jgi:hypothetical protein
MLFELQLHFQTAPVETGPAVRFGRRGEQTTALAMRKVTASTCSEVGRVPEAILNSTEASTFCPWS